MAKDTIESELSEHALVYLHFCLQFKLQGIRLKDIWETVFLFNSSCLWLLV